ncbi:N-acetylmannosamine-6-phosphate 2-epimerase [Mesorhizobium sp. BHbsci]
MTLTQLLPDSLYGTLVVSCQADAGTPLAAPTHLAAIAAAVVEGGASAIRTEGLANVEAVRACVAVPVIGLVKTSRADTEIYITPSIEDARAIARAGADIIAFDGTARPRPASVVEMVAAIAESGALSMADISTVAEARAAVTAGADLVSTTMAGYTSYTPADEGPDFGLMRALGRAGIPFVAEGRIWTTDEALQCFDLGASFVVVGSAITRPTLITQRFARSIAGRQPATPQRKVPS